MPIITRKQYMAGSAALHQPYYRQFVSVAILDMVARNIKVERIVASQDPHFNNIPLREWDMLPIKSYIDRDLWRTAEGHTDPTKFWWSLSSNTCIAKAAAGIIRDHKGDMVAARASITQSVAA